MTAESMPVSVFGQRWTGISCLLWLVFQNYYDVQQQQLHVKCYNQPSKNTSHDVKNNLRPLLLDFRKTITQTGRARE